MNHQHNSLARRVATAFVCLAGMALIVASGSESGGSREVEISVRVNGVGDSEGTNQLGISVVQGTTGSIRVDISAFLADDPSPSVTVAGYSIDLPETVADIDIATEPCPAGVGTPSCEIWQITPGPRSTPGRYEIDITPARPSEPARLRPVAFDITVLPARAAATTGVIQVDNSLGEFGHTLFIDSERRLWGFGDGRDGALADRYLRRSVVEGNGAFVTAQPVVTPPASLLNLPGQRWFQVVAEDGRSIGLRADGTVWRWGLPPNGEALSSLAPQQVEAPPGVAKIAPHFTENRPAMLTLGGRLFRAGDGAELHLGDGADSSMPVESARDLVSRGYFGSAPDHNESFFSALLPGPFAVLGDGRVGAFDQGAPPESRPVLAVISGYADIKGLAAGSHHLLALREEDGAVLSLGDNSVGQLGTGGTDDQACSITAAVCPSGGNCVDKSYQCDPVQVVGIGPATAIAAKGNLSFALLEDGTVWTWGSGIRTPVAVQNLANITAIGPGYAIGGECGGLWGIRRRGVAAFATRVAGIGTQGFGCAPLPSFSLSTASNALAIDLDTPTPLGTLGITVRRNGYLGPVTLGRRGCPRDYTCTIAPNPVPAGQTSATLTVSTPTTSDPVPYSLLELTGEGEGGVPDASATVLLRTLGSTPITPTADFSFTPTAPLVGATVTFDGSFSTDDEPIASYAWDFDGDGDFDDGTGVAPTFVFASTGSKTVRLKVTDTDDQTHTAVLTVNVQPAGPQSVRLTVSVAGPGSVAFNPPVSTCPPDCEATYALVTPATNVQLSAEPEGGALFFGWSGDCSGSGLQNVAMSANRTCTASFAVAPPPPRGWRSLGLVTALNVSGRPVLAPADAGELFAAYLEAGPTLHNLVVKSSNTLAGTWEPFGIGVVNPGAVATTTSFDFINSTAFGAVIAWNEGNQIKLAGFNAGGWQARGLLDFGIANTSVAKDSIQLAATATEVVLAWREATAPFSQLAVARLDRNGFINGGVLSHAYIPGVTGVSAFRLVLSPTGAATIAYVLGDGVIEGATRVVRLTATGWEPLGGDAAPGSGLENAALLQGFGLVYDAGGAPVVINNTGRVLAYRRYDGTTWVPQGGGGNGTFLLLNQNEFLGTVATVRPDSAPRYFASLVSRPNPGAPEFRFADGELSAGWIPTADTLIQSDGGTRAAAAVTSDGRLNIARVRDIGTSSGIEVHQYVP